MARSGVPPVTRLLLICLCSCTLLTFVLRYSAYIHLVSADVHDEDHEHLINDGSATDTPTTDSLVPSPQDIYVPLIALVPGHTSLLSKPWTLFTSAFIEDGFISFATAFCLILYTGRYIEVLWGSREFFYYIVSNVFLSSLVAYVIYGFQTLTADEDRTIQITGTAAIIIALLVAIKQRIPNHYLLFLNGFVRLKVSFVPFMVLFFSTVLSFVIPEYKTTSVLNWTGFITSWIFLRFFKEGGSGRQLAILPTDSQSSSQLPSRGDRTAQFALATFFPSPVSLLVDLIAEKVFAICCRFHLLDKNSFTGDEQELDTSPQELSLSSNISQSDIVSTMSQSRIFTSSSLAGVSGAISPLSFPKGSALQKFTDKVFGFGGSGKREGDVTLDKRRKLALMQLDSKLGDQV